MAGGVRKLFLSGTYEVYFGPQGLRKWTYWEKITVETETGMMNAIQEKGGMWREENTSIIRRECEVHIKIEI